VRAVQGPRWYPVLDAVGLPTGHEYMSFVEAPFEGEDVVVCRTGYTGERGYELIAPAEVGPALWDRLMAAGEPDGILACGLGARDTLRTEMGYPLHGQDITIEVTPNQARLGWAVGWKKDRFWGREALLAEKEAGPTRLLRGLVAAGRGIPRPGMLVFLAPDVPLGSITSGTFSPTLRQGIGMALLPSFVNPEAELTVDVRGRRELFRSAKVPFVDPSVRES
jgi:aminomethyltransferase